MQLTNASTIIAAKGKPLTKLETLGDMGIWQNGGGMICHNYEVVRGIAPLGDVTWLL
jgi:hypothetical protein